MSDNTGFAGLWRMLGYLPLFRTTILDTTWFQLSGGHVEVGRTDGRTDAQPLFENASSHCSTGRVQTLRQTVKSYKTNTNDLFLHQWTTCHSKLHPSSRGVK